jgi:hypothetical protein
MGMSLWDVRFRGERIAYEIKPQECLVQYAGHDPVQGITSWMDRFFGMGLFTRDLLPNYDCPAEAVFLPGTLYHPILGAITRKKAICVFEIDTGKPLTRHYGDWPGETGAVKGYVLTVRTIATLGKCVPSSHFHSCEHNLTSSIDSYDYLVRSTNSGCLVYAHSPLPVRLHISPGWHYRSEGLCFRVSSGRLLDA